MIANSFNVQLAHFFGDTISSIIFQGQFMCHICGEHIPNLLQIISEARSDCVNADSFERISFETNEICHKLRPLVVQAVKRTTNSMSCDASRHALVTDMKRFSLLVVDQYVHEIAKIVGFMFDTKPESSDVNLTRLVNGACARVLEALKHESAKWCVA
jgi:hypothetical protein